MIIDLKTNTIDGKKTQPLLCEFLSAVSKDRWTRTGDLICRLWGVNEPKNPVSSIGQLAWMARKSGYCVIGHQKLGYRFFE